MIVLYNFIIRNLNLMLYMILFYERFKDTSNFIGKLRNIQNINILY